jgi:hypothetical protein
LQALSSTITSLGGTPVQPCTYDFSAVTNVTTYLGVARLLENTGVTAYDGERRACLWAQELQEHMRARPATALRCVSFPTAAGAVAAINEATLQTVAATIATVEGRHASYLNEVTGDIPFPSAFDTAAAPTTVIGEISPFLVSCAMTPAAPVVLVVTPCNSTSGLAMRRALLGSEDEKAVADLNSRTASSGSIRRHLQATSVPTAAELLTNDIAALNYALTLEHLEATFYNTFQAHYSAAAFEQGEQLCVLPELPSVDRSYDSSFTYALIHYTDCLTPARSRL